MKKIVNSNENNRGRVFHSVLGDVTNDPYQRHPQTEGDQVCDLENRLSDSREAFQAIIMVAEDMLAKNREPQQAAMMIALATVGLQSCEHHV